MTEKIYLVTDIGQGDGGKGGVVHKISTMMNAHTIIKVGGAQGSHGVHTSHGEEFNFNQWGCGTFEGVKTHISPRMIISAEGLLVEADDLRYECGVHDPFALLTIDERALCATSYHGIASRLKEMARGKNPRGTTGAGIGTAYQYAQRFPELSIRALDFSRSNIKEILAAIREQIKSDIDSIIHGDFLPDDQNAARENINLLYDDGFLDYIAKQIQEVSKKAKIVGPEYLKEKILSQEGVAVVESSQGILTDHYFGFYPHVSAIRTLPCFAQKMLRDSGYNGKIINMAVHRAYGIRHGDGPMPTDDPTMAESLLPNSHKNWNRYQGKIRVGQLDLVLLRYAIEACGGPNAFDGLAITWFDQIKKNGIWNLCYSYDNADDQTFFTPDGDIKVWQGENDERQLEYQKNLGKQLLRCIPKITSIDVPSTASQDDLYSFCAKIIEERTKIPVRMVSFGPTELDKICK